jgi:arginine/lysine/ornithine decarboxylase
MKAGADMAAASMHKTGGSLTQSSILLCSKNINADYVRQIINLLQTTSSSYLLLSSLDLARRNLSIHGTEIFRKTIELANYARNEINQLSGYYAYSTELIDHNFVFDFDQTKLSIFTRDIGLAGIEVYDILRDEYGIQIEFGDIGNILAIVSSGDRKQDIERLISALLEIKRLYKKDASGMFNHEYINPKVIITPQKAFYANKKSVPMNESTGRVCAEFVMSYPPGIPILAPGEIITKEILDYIFYAKEKKCLLTGTQDMQLEHIFVVEDI